MFSDSKLSRRTQNCSRPTPKSALVGKISLELGKIGVSPKKGSKSTKIPPKMCFFYCDRAAPRPGQVENLFWIYFVDLEPVFAGSTPILPSSREILPTRPDFGVGLEQFWSASNNFTNILLQKIFRGASGGAPLEMGGTV